MARPTRIPEADLAERMKSLKGWERKGEAITRTFKFAGFPEAVAFVTRLVAPAEQREHHPDLDVRYNKVTVTLSTHDQGGLTAADFELAALVDGAVEG